MNAAEIYEEIERLAPFSEEPERQAMSRSEQFPSTHGRILKLNQELVSTRTALRDALALLRLCAGGFE